MRILEAKGYSVVVRLHPHNTMDNLTNNEKHFMDVIGDALLIICPPPSPPAAKPMEEESNGSSTGASSLQVDSDGSTLEKSDDNSTSEVQNKMIIMGHQILSCHVPVVRSFFIL